MSFWKKNLLRQVPAIALCAALGMSNVSAYSDSAAALSELPAADTTTAAIGMITSAEKSAIGSVRTTEEMTKAKEDLAAKKAAEEAARKAAEEAARKAAEEARLAALQYTPTYRCV